MRPTFLSHIALSTLLCSLPAFAQYNRGAGHNAPAPASVQVERVAKDGKKYVATEVREAPLPRPPLPFHSAAAGVPSRLPRKGRAATRQQSSC